MDTVTAITVKRDIGVTLRQQIRGEFNRKKGQELMTFFTGQVGAC